MRYLVNDIFADIELASDEPIGILDAVALAEQVHRQTGRCRAEILRDFASALQQEANNCLAAMNEACPSHV